MYTKLKWIKILLFTIGFSGTLIGFIQTIVYGPVFDGHQTANSYSLTAAIEMLIGAVVLILAILLEWIYRYAPDEEG